jgi:mono/diheme cytochrome c family protein
MKTHLATIAALITGGLLIADGAFAQGMPADGKEIAERWCAPCHRVSPDQPNANVDVPGFSEIAARSANDYAWLEPFLADPHPPMPNFSLTRDEIANLVAYIRSLR